MDEPTKRVWDVALALAQLALAIAGGLWVFFRFRRERTHVPRIAFGLECRLHGPEQRAYVAEFVLRLRNDGAVIHRIRDVKLRVRGIRAGQPLDLWKGKEPRLSFPEKIIDDADVLYKEKYSHVFVEPGVEQELMFVTRVSAEMAFLLARAEFKYEDGGRTHSTERVIDVPQSPVA